MSGSRIQRPPSPHYKSAILGWKTFWGACRPSPTTSANLCSGWELSGSGPTRAEWIWSKSGVDIQWAGMTRGKAQPICSLSPRNLTETWLSHIFPYESVVQWPQTLNVDDNGSFLAISTKQNSEDEQEKQGWESHTLRKTKSPRTRGRGKGQAEMLRIILLLAHGLLFLVQSHTCILYSYPGPFPPLLWVINGELFYFQLNDACLRNSSEFSTNLFKLQFSHL